jgi:hypothetical protein
MSLMVNRLIILFLCEYLVLCLFASFRFLDVQSTITLLLFSFLFSSLTFQLNGSFTLKLCLLTGGNFIGLFWNLIFYHFANAGTDLFGESFKTFYVLIYPFLNLMWIVPFWSFSLGLLPKMPNSARRNTL